MATSGKQALQPGELLLFSETIQHHGYGDHVTEVGEPFFSLQPGAMEPG